MAVRNFVLSLSSYLEELISYLPSMPSPTQPPGGERALVSGPLLPSPAASMLSRKPEAGEALDEWVLNEGLADE